MNQYGAPSSAPQAPAPREPQKRLANRPSVSSLVDLGLPSNIKRRRLTQAAVSAVCEQLGEHVSTRNVQRVLGGSLRDVGPMVKAWRVNRSRAGAAADSAASTTQVQAIGAILLGALQDHSEAIERSQVQIFGRVETLLRNVEARLGNGNALSGANNPSQQDPHVRARDRQHADGAEIRKLTTAVRALEVRMDQLVVQGLPTPSINARLDRLAQSLSSTQTAAPASLELTEMSSAIGALDTRLTTLTQAVEQLPQLMTSVPAPADVAPALASLEHGVVKLTDQVSDLASAVAKRRNPGPTRAITRRLDVVDTRLATVSSRLAKFHRRSAQERPATSSIRRPRSTVQPSDGRLKTVTAKRKTSRLVTIRAARSVRRKALKAVHAQPAGKSSGAASKRLANGARVKSALIRRSKGTPRTKASKGRRGH